MFLQNISNKINDYNNSSKSSKSKKINKKERKLSDFLKKGVLDFSFDSDSVLSKDEQSNKNVEKIKSKKNIKILFLNLNYFHLLRLIKR